MHRDGEKNVFFCKNTKAFMLTVNSPTWELATHFGMLSAVFFQIKYIDFVIVYL